MSALFRKKSFLDRVKESLRHQQKRVGTGAVRTGLITLGSVAAVTAASAAVSAVRSRQGSDDGDARQ
ncbi:hypothetical protein [Cellulosimicrobium protaetiae]